MSAYADTSALRRLLVQDEARGLLENYLREQDGLATCDLTVTELHRVGGWYDLDAGVVQDVLDRFDRILLTAALFRQAGLLPHMPGTYLRSLDALHIVAALDTSQAPSSPMTSARPGPLRQSGSRSSRPGDPGDWHRI